MKIAIAQTRPFKAGIEKNIAVHEKLCRLAADQNADYIFFPELSITRYDADLAKNLATTKDDKRFDVFAKISTEKNITIAIGVPTKTDEGIRISLVIFKPSGQRELYSKQYLHADEFPYFVCGEEQILLKQDGLILAPAICYESLLPEHAANVVKQGATIYVTSVAKSANGVAKAYKHYPAIAAKYNMPVLMSNCIGPCDTFEAVGASAIWDNKGELLKQMDNKTEGLLIFDTVTEEVIEILT